MKIQFFDIQMTTPPLSFTISNYLIFPKMCVGMYQNQH